jgi:mannose-6-phosphate isomerase
VAPGVTEYETGCEYFAVRRFDLSVGPTKAPGSGPRIVACVDGTTSVDADGTEEAVRLSAGQSAFVGGTEGPCTLRGSGTAFVVSAR